MRFCNCIVFWLCMVLSYTVEAYTFTQAIAIELLRNFRLVYKAPRALQQFIQQTLTDCPLVRVTATQWGYYPQTPIVLTVFTVLVHAAIPRWLQGGKLSV